MHERGIDNRHRTVRICWHRFGRMVFSRDPGAPDRKDEIAPLAVASRRNVQSAQPGAAGGCLQRRRVTGDIDAGPACTGHRFEPYGRMTISKSFGPQTVRSLGHPLPEEGIELANEMIFGPIACFHASDLSRATRVQEAFDRGKLGVSAGLVATVVAPLPASSRWVWPRGQNSRHGGVHADEIHLHWRQRRLTDGSGAVTVQRSGRLALGPSPVANCDA